MHYWTDTEYGNPNSLHFFGRRAREGIEKARKQVADFLNCQPKQIIFTSSGTESNYLAIYGLRKTLQKEDKKHIIMGKGEHDSGQRAVAALGEFLYGEAYETQISSLPLLENGKVDTGNLDFYAWSDTGLCSVQYVNHEVGSVNDIFAIGEFCNRKGIYFHTDCTQAAGYFDLDVEKIGCDFLTFSAHKIHGIKGAGCLYAKDPGLLTPLMAGGSSQEFGLRGGTENVPAIVAFGEACHLLKPSILLERAKIDLLHEQFVNALWHYANELGVADKIALHGSSATEGKIVNLAVLGVDAQILVLALSHEGIYVSAGSACSSLEDKPSPTLLAMGLPTDEARSSIRISLSSFNTAQEMDTAARELASCVAELSEIAI